VVRDSYLAVRKTLDKFSDYLSKLTIIPAILHARRIFLCSADKIYMSHVASSNVYMHFQSVPADVNVAVGFSPDVRDRNILDIHRFHCSNIPRRVLSRATSCDSKPKVIRY